MKTLQVAVLLVVSLVAGFAISSAAAAAGESKTLLLYSFEPGQKLPEQDGEIVKEHATEGQYSLKLTNPGEGWKNWTITDKKVLAEFKNYMLLKADVFNPTDEPISYGARIDDAQSNNFGSRYNNDDLVAPPGLSTLEINLTSLLRSSSKNFSARGKLDVATLTRAGVHMSSKKGSVTLYFDNIRLETSGLPAVEGLHAFDFGPAKSAVFPGFDGVSESMPYTAERGYGWNKCETSDRVYTPDDLTADFLGGGNFEMDLPNGTYEVNTCIDTFGSWHRYPSFEWRKLTLNGKVVLDEKMTGAQFLDKCYYAHEDQEDLPGQDLWNKYIAPRNVNRRYTVEVTNKKLTMSLDASDKYGLTVCYLVVYPAAKLAEGRQWMDTLEAKRREHFNKDLFVVVPKSKNPPLPPQSRAGAPFDLFVRHSVDDISVQDAPSADEMKKALEIEAAQGEREHAQFGIYSTGDVKDATVQVSELAGPGGAKIPASAVEVRKVRNFLKHQGRQHLGTILPYILMDFDKLDLTPSVTRGIWVTVAVPENQAPGVYTGTVKVGTAAASKSLPMAVKVLPFKLGKVQSITISTTGGRSCMWDKWYPDLNDRGWKMAEVVMNDYAIHGMNAITGGPGAKLKSIKDGKATVDYTDMDRWLALATKYGLTMPGDSYQGLDIANIPRDTKNMQKNEDAAKKFGVTYDELLKAAFANLEEHAKEKGWMPRVYYILDEPRPEFGNIESALEITKKWVAAAPHTLFSGYYTPGEGRDAYFAVMPVTISHFTSKAMSLAKAGGNQLWDYDGHRDRFNIGRWAFAASKAGLTGYLRNGYQYVNSDPYFDFSDDEASWCVVYPSKHDKMNASVGWERTAQGANDFRYLELLDGLIKKAAGKPEAAAAKAFLDATLKPIDLEHRETASLSGEQFDVFKDTCANHIIALKKALGE